MGVHVIRCSVIKYRKNYYVLYPVGGESREKVGKLYGRKVYAVIIAED